MSRRYLLVVVLVAAAFFGWAQAAHAAPINVTRYDDPATAGNCGSADTDCSLRQAIAAVNSDHNVISLPAGTYTLSLPTPPLGGPGGALFITQDLTIIGGGSASQSTVITADYGTFDDRLITISADAQTPPDVTLENLSLDGGSSTGKGGAIASSGVNLILTDVTFDSNSATDGGALWLQSRTASGTGVTFSNNRASDGSGGAVLVNGRSLALTNSTVVNGSGGGIENTNSDALITLTNVTMNDNAPIDLDSVGETESSNTIFGDGCTDSTSINSGDGNIDPTDMCGGFGSGDDQGDPAGLGSLADNGGPTETVALLPGSTALGFGNGECPNDDQRHVDRGSTCDSGAFAGPLYSVTAGVPLSVSFFDEFSECPPSATIDWGDGTGAQDATVDCGPRPPDSDFLPVTISGTNTYGSAGLYHIVGAVGGDSFPGSALVAAAPPTVGAPDVTGATTTTAVVEATINPNGPSTSYLVNYGTTTNYGQQTGSVDVGSGTTDQAVSATLQGLLPGTTYHVQVAATNSVGTTVSSDATFTTTAAPASPPPPPALSPPTVGGPTFNDVTTTTAAVSATVDPNGSPTFYHFEYGPTAAYGQQTGPVAAGSGTTAQAVGATLTGLSPGTTYHVRIVAANPGGTTASSDATFTTTATGPPPPVQGQSLDVAPFSGNVLVNGQPLTIGQQIPFGSIIDARNGTITLISIGPTGQLQSASFTGAIFQVVQAADGSTELILQGGDFSVCKNTQVRRTAGLDAKPKPKPKSKAKATKGRRTPPKVNTTVVRSLWGNGTGQFTTKGRYAAATVRGTVWHTSDRCDGTSVEARTGVVAVLDLVTGKTIILTAPATYLAHP